VNRPGWEQIRTSGACGFRPLTHAARWRTRSGGARVRVSGLQASWPRGPEARRRGKSAVVQEERSQRLSPWSWGPVRHWRRHPVPEGLRLRLGQGRRVVGLVASERPRQPERRWLDEPARTAPGPVRLVPLVPYRAPHSAAHQHKSLASARSHQDHPARESHHIRRRTWHSPHHLWPARQPAPHLETLP